MSFFEFIGKNWKEHWGYFWRNVIMFIVLFVVGTQLVLILYFLVGKTSKLVWIFLDHGFLINVLKCAPIGAFAMALHGAIMKWNEQKNAE